MTLKRPTYGRLELRDGRWVLSDVKPHVAIKLKQIFQRIPKTKTGSFELPDTEEVAADLDWLMVRYAFDIGDGDLTHLKRNRELFEIDKAESEAILLPDWAPGPVHGFKPGYKLHHHQAQARELVLKKKALLLGDVMGQGKSWTALGTLIGSPYLPAAIVVKTHLAQQWVDEFIKPYTYLSAHIIQGTKPYNLPPANIYLFKYSNIHGWVDLIDTGFFKAAVFDEAHELRNGTNTEKGKASKVLADNAHIKLLLTGTPIFNYGSEIFGIMKFVNPELLGSWDEFTREWCEMGPGQKWVVTNPQALGSYLRDSQVFLRRLREGRPVNKLVVEVDYENDVAEATEDLVVKLALKTTTGTFVERGQAARELDALARQVTGMAKAKSVAAYVRMLLEAGRPVLLFGWHRSVYDAWMKELADFNPVMFTGSETPRQKEKAKEAFLSGKTDLCIMSLRSGEGTDGLQKRCSTVVFGELDWAGAVHSQGVGRVDRPGQQADVIDVIYLVANEGSDPVVMRVNAIKADQFQGIIDLGIGPSDQKSDMSRLQNLAKHYLEKRKAA